MSYVPSKPPAVSTQDGQALASYLNDELQVLAASLQQTDGVSFSVQNVAPKRPRVGMTVYADGTNWNPGSGEGLYAYSKAGNWIWLEDNPVLPSLPLSVANGGTGDSGTAWTAYTPVVTSDAGAITTVVATGFWKSIGKTIFFSVQFTISSIGTAANTRAIFTLPVAAKRLAVVAVGRATSGTSVAQLVTTIASAFTSAIVTNYDNSGTLAATTYTYGGFYESA